MLTELCAEIHNYFCKPELIHGGTFTIENGSIEPLPFVQTNQYFRIVGSVFNDGVWKYGADNHLTDETFTGYIWPMSIPKAVLDLNDDIEAWLADDAVQSALNSPYASESFGGYSYSVRSKSAYSNDSGAYTWADQFSSRLSPYRKMREI